MLAVATPLLLFLSLFLIVNVDGCTTPPMTTNVCCLEIDPYYCFDYQYGLFVKNPECPYVYSPTYKLFTRTSTSGVPISKANIPAAFSNDRKTVIIIHGFGESFNSKYQTLKNKLLLKEDYNVIGVDWKNGAEAPDIFQAAANTDTLGAYLGSLVNVLRNEPGTDKYFWCIGNGLGAHVCGKTMKQASPLLERITGLDPALIQGGNYGLSKSDAMKVDIIHTDSVWGQAFPRGHVDFYPNGGIGQPGCPAAMNYSLNEELKQHLDSGEPMTCDHGRALDYMINSINSNCYVATHVCTDYENIDASCTEIPLNGPHGVMGYDAINVNYRYDGLLYYEANSNDPYCSSRQI